MKKEIIINNDDNFAIKRIKQICLNRKWSYYRLAKETGIAYTTYSNMFKNNTMPTLPTLEHICSGFDISLSEFFAEENERTTDQEKLILYFNRLDAKKREYALDVINKLNDI